MLRKIKEFGRCTVQGHGSNWFCEVCAEIQNAAISRAKEKREFEKEIQTQIKEQGE